MRFPFVDRVKIYVKAGDGGSGAVAFLREKFRPRGGPAGGDGGKGGDVVLVATASKHTLLDFKYRRHFRAENGQPGRGKKQKGRDGEDLILHVPLGTVVRDAQKGEILCDLTVEGQKCVVARGGRGGRGNAHFATPTDQAPRRAEPGEKGEERWILLELKLIADVGIIGLPNAGKSTLISRLTAARPKIAPYPFEFLRHIERTKILLHLIDVSESRQMDPVEAFETVDRELRLYSPELAEKPRIVVASKIDALSDRSLLSKLREYFEGRGYRFHSVSSLTGEGIEELKRILWDTFIRAGGEEHASSGKV